MLCPFCSTEESPVSCVETLLPFPNRVDRILVKIGHWECLSCFWTKPIYKKQPVKEDKLISRATCFCCNDTGVIHHQLVQEFLMEDYQSYDPPVPCKRCNNGFGKNGWDIATKSDCEFIHNRQIKQVKFSDPDPTPDISESIAEIAEQMSF